MPHPARLTQEPARGLSLVLAVADYAATFRVEDESALDAARHCLIESLGRGFEALQDPRRASLIGPVVPGALMPGGARIPGTSLELEPSRAAFCIGLMLCGPAAGDHRPASSHPRAADPLGALLAVADYRARRAAMEGAPPPKVRDVLAAIVKALQIHGVLAALEEEQSPVPEQEALGLLRVTVSALVTAQLGGTPGQIARAVSYASLDGNVYVHPDVPDRPDDHPDVPPTIGRRDWATADSIGRAVHLACQAMGAGHPTSLTSADLELVEIAARRLGSRLPGARRRFGTALIERPGRPRQPADMMRLTQDFGAAVDAHFPMRQAERIKTLFASPTGLDDLPVNELIAALVTNGPRQR